jgi:hypothetical protein
MLLLVDSSGLHPEKLAQANMAAADWIASRRVICNRFTTRAFRKVNKVSTTLG